MSGEWDCKFQGVHEESIEKANGSLKEAMIKSDSTKVNIEHQDNIIAGSYINPVEISNAAKNSDNQKVYTKNKTVLCAVTNTDQVGMHLDCVSTQSRSHFHAEVIDENHLKGLYTRHTDKTGFAREVAAAGSFDCKRQ